MHQLFRIFGYSTVSTFDSVFIIGGFHWWASSSIVKFTEDEVWEHVGNLQYDRHGHNSVLFGSLIFVIGGKNPELMAYVSFSIRHLQIHC